MKCHDICASVCQHVVDHTSAEYQRLGEEHIRKHLDGIPHVHERRAN